jgi:hypothetical protein
MTAARKKTADDSLTVGLAQIAPVWLNREKTLAKVIGHVEQAAAQGCRLVAFGEALVPGYPFWIELTDGARFNSPVQKELHAYYASQAVQIDREALALATLEHRRVREERQNFDPSGHYARPDVTQLSVNRERQRTVIYTE